MSKFLQAKILEQLTGAKSRVVVPPVAQEDQRDMFELPPLPQGEEGAVSSKDNQYVVRVGGEAG